MTTIESTRTAAADQARTEHGYPELDATLAELDRNKAAWLRVGTAERIDILGRIKECLMPVAQAWAETASRKKGIAPGSPLEGEEWSSGPYALMAFCNALADTLGKVDGKRHLAALPKRELPNGQLAVQVLPHTGWDRLLLAGYRAEVWMQPGVTRANLAQHTASAYDGSDPHAGRVALVLGAGNIASIAPLDAMHKLFAENQVAIVKMNPVNDYLIEFLEAALKPLIGRGVLRFVRGDAAVGQYLCTHPLVEEIHITGSGAVHDQIVWGAGEEGARNRRAGTPKNPRRITSELGAVCPTIVVPGPWSERDLAHHGEHVASQKLHNAGFNCIACQVLIVSSGWDKTPALVGNIKRALAATEERPLYYPGAGQRVADFMRAAGQEPVPPQSARECVVVQRPVDAEDIPEVFGPALSVTELPETDPERYLIDAIDQANRTLHGTLGANILIHPSTLRQIGRRRFEEILAGLHYGCIAVNTWSGLGFLTPGVPWGAFPGHTLDDVQSGIGFVHNTMLFDRPERTVIMAPFRAFPRPPWFVTNRRAAELGRLLTRFQYRPGWLPLARIFACALGG